MGKQAAGRLHSFKAWVKIKYLKTLKRYFKIVLLSKIDISKVVLLRDREQIISSCFDVKVNFKYPQKLDKLNMELEFF